jgi:hypothetical protein
MPLTAKRSVFAIRPRVLLLSDMVVTCGGEDLCNKAVLNPIDYEILSSMTRTAANGVIRKLNGSEERPVE